MTLFVSLASSSLFPYWIFQSWRGKKKISPQTFLLPTPFLFPFVEKLLERLIRGYGVHLCTCHSRGSPSFALCAPATWAAFRSLEYSKCIPAIGLCTVCTFCLYRFSLPHRLAPFCHSELSFNVTSSGTSLTINLEITCVGSMKSLHF